VDPLASNPGLDRVVRSGAFPVPAGVPAGAGALGRTFPLARPVTDARPARDPAETAASFVEDLFGRHHAEIFAFLVRMLRDEELAADLAQDTFIKAYRAYDHLGPPDNARAWLYQIANRVALDELRRRKIIRFLPWTGESNGAAPSAERVAMDTRLSGPLARALERIPERQRAALLLAELHDLTGLELAAALGVSHVAARALLTRARDSLRRALDEEQAAEDESLAGGTSGAAAKPNPAAGTSARAAAPTADRGKDRGR
jgi:RNA polymerase sigma-70 factor (ECF subfamily)